MSASASLMPGPSSTPGAKDADLHTATDSTHQTSLTAGIACALALIAALFVSEVPLK
ncbi:hypothetical protein [Streptomyces sp. NPDC059991]|uniref:hypothetical protein n=1 Tax=unclassified Streptomyces TaxID=2593676 RepID=UPI0036C1B95B